MKNKGLEKKLSEEIIEFLNQRLTLNLSTLDESNYPYASYAPYALGDECIYVLLSDLAVHGKNLKQNNKAAIQIIEDESEAENVFARQRVNYQVTATHIQPNINGEEYEAGIQSLTQKHGDKIHSLASLGDFNLFCLSPLNGRYIKGFGRAYTIQGHSLSGESIDALKG